jgi:hypothetical protein
MSSIRPDNYAALLSAFAAQPRGRQNFALAARQAGVDQRTAKRIYQKGLAMTHSREAMPPISVALATLAAGAAASSEVVPDTLQVLRAASASLLQSSAPFVRAMAAVAPTLEAKLQALDAKDAAAIFTEFSRSLARVVDSTEKIRAIEAAIAWEREAPARAAAEAAKREAERLRLEGLPDGHWAKPIPWDPL